MIYAMVEYEFVFIHRLATLSQNVSVAAVRMIFFRTSTKTTSRSKNALRTAAAATFTPPLKMQVSP